MEGILLKRRRTWHNMRQEEDPYDKIKKIVQIYDNKTRFKISIHSYTKMWRKRNSKCFKNRNKKPKGLHRTL